MKRNLHRGLILLIIFTMSFSIQVTASTADTYKDRSDLAEAENNEDIQDLPLEQNEEERPAIEEVDLENLSIALDEALHIDIAQETGEIQAAIEEANILLSSEEVTQTEVDATTEILNEAIQNAPAETEPIDDVNKAILQSTIEEATVTLNGLDSEDATSFIDALAAANMVFDNPNATQDEVDAVDVELKQAIDDVSASDGEREVEVVDDLITIITDGSYDQNEALQMIDNLQSIFPNLYQGLIDNGVKMYLINFPITQLEAFEHLAGVVPRGWEDTGNTWDDVPGAGGQNSAARIGHSLPGNGHGSLNLELHEIAHPIDTIVLGGISSSDEFLEIHAEEQPSFLPDVYFSHPEEYFAEAFSYYFISDELRGALQQGAPRTYAFIENLAEENSTPPEPGGSPDAPEEVSDEQNDFQEEENLQENREALNERIEAARELVDEDGSEYLSEALNNAISVSENPIATVDEVNTAIESLSHLIEESQQMTETQIEINENSETRNTDWETIANTEDTDELISSGIVNGSLLPSTATNTPNFVLAGILLILGGAILIMRELYTN